MLDFINNNQATLAAEGKVRICQGSIIRLISKIEYCCAIFLSNHPGNGCLATLTRPKQRHDWGDLKGAFDAFQKLRTRYHETMVLLEILDVNSQISR